VSLALSYGVAFSKALLGKARPTKNVAAYVYEIEVGGRVSTRASLADPVREVAEAASAPTAAINYQHDGDPYFIARRGQSEHDVAASAATDQAATGISSYSENTNPNH